jgi:hypothetical protein
VAGAAAIGAIDTGTAARFLQQLAERSLVLRAADRRYVLLETLRAFASEHLGNDPRAARKMFMSRSVARTGD